MELKPTTEDELSRAIAQAGRDRRPLEVVGRATKRAIGRPAASTQNGPAAPITPISQVLTTENLRGITLYEPNELVLSALAGTPLATIETELAKHNQQLAFEPLDPGAFLRGQNATPGAHADAAPRGPSIGGVFATNLSGPRRIYAGAARDHLLGIRAANGRGEIFKSGGRVMKNVTGYDLCRTLAGSWGTLGVMTEVTMKVVPRPEETQTLLIAGLPDEMANEVMCAAMITPYEVSAASHLQAGLAAAFAGTALTGDMRAFTALRIENVSSSVAYRMGRLKKRFAAYGEVLILDDTQSAAFWSAMRELTFFQGGSDPVWRISTTPSKGHRMVRNISQFTSCRAVYDWSGGLIWLEVPETADASAADIRRIVATLGGHATLMRAHPSVRASVDVFQPLEHGPQMLSRRIKEAFDPLGILNPARMYAGL